MPEAARYTTTMKKSHQVEAIKAAMMPFSDVEATIAATMIIIDIV